VLEALGVCDGIPVMYWRDDHFRRMSVQLRLDQTSSTSGCWRVALVVVSDASVLNTRLSETAARSFGQSVAPLRHILCLSLRGIFRSRGGRLAGLAPCGDAAAGAAAGGRDGVLGWRAVSDPPGREDRKCHAAAPRVGRDGLAAGASVPTRPQRFDPCSASWAWGNGAAAELSIV
jgi:hypothetical protein